MTDRMDIESVLSQMRSIKSQAQQGVMPGVMGLESKPEDQRAAFSSILKDAVDRVNTQQMDAKSLAESYERGDPNVDLPQVMISAQKASVAFDAMVEVRNKLISAYEDIAKMPI